MNQNNEPVIEKTEAVEPKSSSDKEPTVKINREKYVVSRTASGAKSLSNGDEVAKLLEGMPIDALHDIADKAFKDNDFRTRYAKLNKGMQRMNLGNRLRGWATKRDAENVKLIADKKDPKKSGIEALAKFSSVHRAKADKEMTAAADKKVIAAKASADKKATK